MLKKPILFSYKITNGAIAKYEVYIVKLTKELIEEIGDGFNLSNLRKKGYIEYLNKKDMYIKNNSFTVDLNTSEVANDFDTIIPNMSTVDFIFVINTIDTNGNVYTDCFRVYGVVTDNIKNYNKHKVFFEKKLYDRDNKVFSIEKVANRDQLLIYKGNLKLKDMKKIHYSIIPYDLYLQNISRSSFIELNEMEILDKTNNLKIKILEGTVNRKVKIFDNIVFNNKELLNHIIYIRDNLYNHVNKYK